MVLGAVIPIAANFSLTGMESVCEARKTKEVKRKIDAPKTKLRVHYIQGKRRLK